MSGNVPSTIGTGLRQFAGIFAVTDISGNNLCTFSSNSIVLGNTLGAQTYNFYGGTLNLNLQTQVVDSVAPTLVLNATSAPSNQKLTTLRLGGSGSGTFAISSAPDNSPTGNGSNLIVGVRLGTTWTSLQFGDALSNPTFTFAGTNPVVAAGFQTLSGTTAVLSSGSVAPAGAPLPSAAFSTYLVTASIASTSDPNNYNAVALVSTNLGVAKMALLQSAGLLTISLSGLQVQVSQTSGLNNFINWTMTRIA